MSINRGSLEPRGSSPKRKLACIEERLCWKSEDLQNDMLAEKFCSECGRNMEQRCLLFSEIGEIMA